MEQKIKNGKSDKGLFFNGSKKTSNNGLRNNSNMPSVNRTNIFTF